MPSRAQFLSIVTAVAIVTGCATPQTQPVSVSDSATKEEADRQMDIAAQELMEEQQRLTRVFLELATKAVSLCGEHVGPATGAYLMVKPKGELGDALARVYGLEDKPTVAFVLAGSPADKAGLTPRDVILGVNGKPTPDQNAFAALEDELPAADPIAFKVARAGQEIAISVQPLRACRYSAQLDPQQVINAYADGKHIFVARGMMGFTKDDDELALVLSHEMAHNIMGHIEAKKRNMGVGLLADLAAAILSRGQVSGTNFAQLGAGAYSQEFEGEADYVGLYIMQDAGLPIANAPKFWRRMAAMAPGNIKSNYSASHPSTAYRMVALEETVKEINAKVSKGEPLVPNMKDGKFAAPAR